MNDSKNLNRDGLKKVPQESIMPQPITTGEAKYPKTFCSNSLPKISKENLFSISCSPCSKTLITHDEGLLAHGQSDRAKFQNSGPQDSNEKLLPAARKNSSASKKPTSGTSNEEDNKLDPEPPPKTKNQKISKIQALPDDKITLNSPSRIIGTNEDSLMSKLSVQSNVVQAKDKILQSKNNDDDKKQMNAQVFQKPNEMKDREAKINEEKKKFKILRFANKIQQILCIRVPRLTNASDYDNAKRQQMILDELWKERLLLRYENDDLECITKIEEAMKDCIKWRDKLIMKFTLDRKLKEEVEEKRLGERLRQMMQGTKEEGKMQNTKEENKTPEIPEKRVMKESRETNDRIVTIKKGKEVNVLVDAQTIVPGLLENEVIRKEESQVEDATLNEDGSIKCEENPANQIIDKEVETIKDIITLPISDPVQTEHTPFREEGNQTDPMDLKVTVEIKIEPTEKKDAKVKSNLGPVERKKFEISPIFQKLPKDVRISILIKNLFKNWKHNLDPNIKETIKRQGKLNRWLLATIIIKQKGITNRFNWIIMWLKKLLSKRVRRRKKRNRRVLKKEKPGYKIDMMEKWLLRLSGKIHKETSEHGFLPLLSRFFDINIDLRKAQKPVNNASEILKERLEPQNTDKNFSTKSSERKLKGIIENLNAIKLHKTRTNYFEKYRSQKNYVKRRAHLIEEEIKLFRRNRMNNGSEHLVTPPTALNKGFKSTGVIKSGADPNPTLKCNTAPQLSETGLTKADTSLYQRNFYRNNNLEDTYNNKTEVSYQSTGRTEMKRRMTANNDSESVTPPTTLNKGNKTKGVIKSGAEPNRTLILITTTHLCKPHSSQLKRRTKYPSSKNFSSKIQANSRNEISGNPIRIKKLIAQFMHEAENINNKTVGIRIRRKVMNKRIRKDAPRGERIPRDPDKKEIPVYAVEAQQMVPLKNVSIPSTRNKDPGPRRFQQDQNPNNSVPTNNFQDDSHMQILKVDVSRGIVGIS
jgi:hypothetical protein